MGSIYVVILFIRVQNATLVQPIVSIERTIFYRERAFGQVQYLISKDPFSPFDPFCVTNLLCVMQVVIATHVYLFRLSFMGLLYMQ